MLNTSYPLINILINYQNTLDLEEKLTLRMNPDQIPDLHWKLTNTYHTTNIGQSEMGNTSISIHDITVKTCDNVCKTSLNTETCTTQSSCKSIVCSVIPIT